LGQRTARGAARPDETAAARPGHQPGLGPPGPARAAGPDRAPVPDRPVPQRLGQRLLLGRGDLRDQELEGVLFGSFDASNFITVDKTPASLWVMEISGRIFGVNSWSMLVPQALEGVASVAVLYAAVRRWFGPAA